MPLPRFLRPDYAASPLLGALLFVWAAFLAPATPARAQIIWGANGHPFTAYPGISLDRQLAYMSDLGLKSYRVNISDLGAVPALAELVRKAKPLGIDILPVITPSLDLKALDAAKLHQGAYDLAYALVSQFKDGIRVWELGNELENHAIITACETKDDGTQYNCDWGPAGGVDALDYYGPRWAKVSAVLKGLSDGASAADPSVRKAMGTAGWGHVGAFERMRRDGIAWDISVWHMYGEDPEWAFKALAEYGRPIWVTEMNHPFGSQNGEAQQAEGMRRWMERLTALATAYRVEAVHIYELLDETYWAPNAEAVMGLVRLEKDGDGWTPGAPKPAYDAVRSVVRGEAAARLPARECKLAEPGAAPSRSAQHVAYAYCLLLGREPDGGGLRDWSAKLESGSSLADVLQAIAGSDEFAARHRTDFLSDAGYVRQLYRLLLGREPDGQGLADYAGRLKAGMARAELVAALVSSDEFKTKHSALLRESG